MSGRLLMRRVASGFLATLLLLVVPGGVRAQTVKGTAVLVPNTAGELLDATVTFELPGSVWIAGSWFIIPERNLVGTHTCTIRGAYTAPTPAEAAERGNTRVFARLNRGKKLGSVFAATVPRDPETSLYNAGCDGDPATVDDFQGTLSATFAGPAVYLGLALASTLDHPDGLSVEDEIRGFFGISPTRTKIIFKLVEFHGVELFNRGGSAWGIASGRLSLKFKP